jgi:hypothetical protein
MATYYDDNGDIKIIAEGQFNSSVLSNGTKKLYFRDSDLSQMETGMFDENGTLADGKKETFYASMQLMVLHEGKFLNSDLTQGKEYIYREDGFLYYESSGDFINGKLGKGKRIHYREDKKIDVIFDGDFSNEVFLQGNVIKYNDEDKIAQQFNGKFNEAREIIEGKVISYNDNAEIAAINQGIFIPVCRIKQEFISQNEFNYYLIKEETTTNISQNIFQALTLFFNNKDELLRKYKKGIVNLGYGKFDYAPAIKEVDYFIKIIILEQIQATAEELTSIKEYILQILQFISPDKQLA